jgi:hypothetical protein
MLRIRDRRKGERRRVVYECTAARATQLEGGQERKGILLLRSGTYKDRIASAKSPSRPSVVGKDGETVDLPIVLIRTSP